VLLSNSVEELTDLISCSPCFTWNGGRLGTVDASGRGVGAATRVGS